MKDEIRINNLLSNIEDDDEFDDDDADLEGSSEMEDDDHVDTDDLSSSW